MLPYLGRRGQGLDTRGAADAATGVEVIMFEIESVELTNFRTFRGTHQFKFPTRPGLYLLTGRNDAEPRLGSNGVGKSTLLDAIYWALYGSTTRGLRAGDVISWGETSCSVQVNMWLNEVPSMIKRTQSPNSLQRSNGALGFCPVSQEDLQKHLSIGPDAFLHSVMLPQFGNSFFDLKPADKLALFTQVMDLDYWLERSQDAATLAGEIEVDRQGQVQEARLLQSLHETASADIARLRVKEQEFDDAQKGIIAELKRDLAKQKLDLKKVTEGIEFTENALINIAKKLAKMEKGTQVCPTCLQPLPLASRSRDAEALLKNQADFERQLSRLQRDEIAANGQIVSLTKQIEREGARANTYAEEIAEKRKLEHETITKTAKIYEIIKELEQEHAAVNYWVNGFKKVRLFVVEEVLHQLEIEVNNNMSSLGLTDWRVEFDVERENKSGGVTKGFTVLIYAPGRAEPVRFEAWSGGETQRLRLAGDLGLANLIMIRAGLTNTMEFYDEPSSHLSEEGINDLLETLQQRAVATGRRIWVVEHHSLDYGEFAGVLMAVKTGEGSRLEWGR